MTEEEAKTELSLMVAATENPTLDAGQISSLIELAKCSDADGRAPSDDGWEPTWNLNRAAVEGWVRKAGLASAKFNFAEDQQRFDRAQIYAHCVQQANEYRRKGVGSAALTIPPPETPDADE